MRAFIQKQNQPQQQASPGVIKANTAAPAASLQVQPYPALATPESSDSAALSPAEAETDSDAEATTRFAHDFTRIPVYAQAPIKLQPKLAVNRPGDAYEQEADRVAEQVMRMPETRLQRTCACGGECARCQAKQPDHQHTHLQTKHVGASESGQTAAPPTVHEVIASSGQPLDLTTRHFMEPRFGYDFSKVRVHDGAVAEQSAREVNARAYTVGHDIVFAAGHFAPGTPEGRRLLAHELTHVVQQSGADRSLVNQSHAQGDLSPTVEGGAKRVSLNAAPVTQRMLQRDIGFEFQTRNFIVGEKGRKFERKFGEYLHKVPPSDKTGVELQTDTGSVAEFETFHFRKWSDLQTQIQNAVDIVTDIKKDPKAFPFNQEKRLKSEGLLKKDEKLEVDIKDSSFKAAIQYTEGFALAQYESALKEHREATEAGAVISSAQNILNDAMKAAKTSSKVNVDNLRGFLQVIVDYIQEAQDTLSRADRVSPVKARFTLLSRTKFSAMFNSLLSADEQKLFKEIVKSGAIPKELSLSGTNEVFPNGYWGHFGEQVWALFQGGKVVALATEDKKTIHDCSSKTKTAGIDVSKCGTKVPDTQVTIDGWLNSIIKGSKDLLSPPPGGGSDSMGKLPIETKGGEKDLVKFETRAEVMTRRNRVQPVDKWVEYADEVFRTAATCRDRPKSGTELIYDGKNTFDPKNCP